MKRGMSLVISLWDDHDVGMIWLDAIDPYPKKGEAPKPGALRGTCNQTSGNYTFVEKYHPDSYALYSDIRYGEIGSTAKGNPNPPPPGPNACPGGSLTACIGKCPHDDPDKYKACLNNCIAHCKSSLVEVKETDSVFPGEFYGKPIAK